MQVYDKVCGWTKESASHRTSWCWNYAVDAAVQEKTNIHKALKSDDIREEYLLAKFRTKKAVYKTKKEAQESLVNKLNNPDGR